MNWAQKIKTGIDCYNKTVLPSIDEASYEIAGMELGDSIALLREGFYTAPFEILSNKTFTDYAKGLLGRLAMLQSSCISKYKERITLSKNKVSERISLIEIMVKPFLDTT